MKSFTVKFSDLGPGSNNPTGIWGVAFHRLQTSIITNQPVEEQKQALYAWLEQKGSTLGDLKKVLSAAKNTEDAARQITDLLKAKLNLDHVSPEFSGGLRKLARVLALEQADSIDQEASTLRNTASDLRKRHQTESLVDDLLK